MMRYVTFKNGKTRVKDYEHGSSPSNWMARYEPLSDQLVKLGLGGRLCEPSVLFALACAEREIVRVAKGHKVTSAELQTDGTVVVVLSGEADYVQITGVFK